MEKKTFHVSVSFDSVSAKNELEAAKKVAGWLKKDATDFIYEVMDEETEKEFTVDLSEEDEDSVLPK